MKLDEVSENYDGAARYYDRLTDIVFGRIPKLEKYRSHTINLLGDISGATVLDVGCGTGRNFPLLVERVELGAAQRLAAAEVLYDAARVHRVGVREFVCPTRNISNWLVWAMPPIVRMRLSLTRCFRAF